MKKRIIILFIVKFIFLSVSAQQGKYGDDEQKCKENLSMFREYYKQKNYLDAYNPWRWSFNNCPESSGNIYKNGPKIIKEKMNSDKANKLAYIDTLMMVFDQRIQYFGKEGYVLGLKGYELIGVDKKRSEEALGYLKRSLEIDGNKASVQAVYGYMKAMVNLEKDGVKTKEDIIEAYALASGIISFNIINESKSAKHFIKYSEKIEDLFTPYANCEDLVSLFNQKLDEILQADSLSGISTVAQLVRIKKVLENKKCTDSKLFFKITSEIYKLEPSSVLASELSKMSISKKESSNAISFAKDAVELELDINTKAKYFLVLADAFRYAGSFSLARDAVYSALEIRNDWGDAYMSLGNIYVSGATVCGNEFNQKTVYWIAVDAFQKALKDEKTKSKASKSINTYSKYFPDTEICFFNGVKSGDSYQIGCWINKSTIVRTSD